jgi:hypothetical protein
LNGDCAGCLNENYCTNPPRKKQHICAGWIFAHGRKKGSSINISLHV